MMRAGVNVESVRQWGGWKSLDTMLRYLADVNATDSVIAMDQVFARMNGTKKQNDKEMTKKPA